MVQSMSRVAHCTDNGVMEGFWGILKREMYYGKKFESREELEKAITEYIDYYTKDRPQRGLGVLTPMEFHEKQRLAAKKCCPISNRATQKFYIFLIVYLTGCTPKEPIFVTLVAAV